MKKAFELLKRFSAGSVAAGVAVFMFVYMVRGTGPLCPFCGGSGFHPWEWGGFAGI